MRLLTRLLILTAILSALASSQTFPSYYSVSDLSLASPGALKFGLYGYDNPALLAYVRQQDFQFAWTDVNGDWNKFNRWGAFTAVPNFGFGVVKTKTESASLTDYRFSLGVGNRAMSWGIAYSFAGGNKSAFNRSNAWTLGALMRPSRYLSVGVIGSAATVGGTTEGAVDLGIRPLGNEMLTLFTDYAIANGQVLKNGSWSYGAAVEALPGICITGRYFDTHAFSLGLSVSFGNAGISGQSNWDKNSNHNFNTYAIRVGAYDRTILQKVLPGTPKYVDLDLNGPINYQRFELFDRTKTLSSILSFINAAKDDPSVSGIAINTSGMEVNREMLWEVREKLKEFKASGKKVIVFIDRGNIDLYHFASVADKIVMDPVGTLMLEGYLFGKTYLKGTLEKLGIGFDEWRFFKYKSANEAFSRDKMSDADHEQWQTIVNDWYSSAKSDICEGRKLTPAQFDSLTSSTPVLLAFDAKEHGLIDSIGRWDVVTNIVKMETGNENGYLSSKSLLAYNEPYDARWGEPPKIAIVYALGVCAMDEGITARRLVKDLEAAVNDPQIKAIVLRIDSPGGDAMASDYIAEAMRKAKGKKPIIVSQGFVAGSGGYWLSMYADTIVAAPGTITGSIGVIGGWLYNKNLKETLGMSTDFVKAGEHADLGFGFRLPFIGLGVPDRNLTVEERILAERMIRSLYKDFVNKVSWGRKKSFDEVDSIGQGRVWSGLDGKKNGLVDILGGIETAIEIAKARAGISQQQKVVLVELPKKGLLDFSMFIPKLFSIETKTTSDPTIEMLQFRLQHNGEAMPLMPLEETQFEFPRE